MNRKLALETTGMKNGLGAASKMPGWTFGIPAKHCQNGGKLFLLGKNKGVDTICKNCYARSGNYVFPMVAAALENRYQALMNALEKNIHPWIDAMTFLIARACLPKFVRGGKTLEERKFFRFHDSGDIQSLDHLKAIISIAFKIPGVKFWVPTKEYAIVKKFFEDGGHLPENFVLRISTPLINKDAAPAIKKLCAENAGLTYSVVQRNLEFPKEIYVCPSSKQNNSCGSCRACWNPDVKAVSYVFH